MLDLGQQQPLRHSRARGSVRRIVPQVVELAGIAFEIVKLAPSGAVEQAQAVAAVDQVWTRGGTSVPGPC